MRLNFASKVPSKYEEPNNKSFRENELFGVDEVKKMLENGVIEEVQEDDVGCLNPLSVASNKKGKKRLCLDLSRHVNESCQAKRFRIESVQDFIKAVKQGSWCWFYDLKSAFHHISIIQKHRKYLGFRVVIDGRVRVFQFVAMPFGYKDASRILTKVMRTPVCRWRAMNIPSYIHIDDGLGFKKTREEARIAANRVKEDLYQLGLITSEKKCQWDPVQVFIWCGFKWDLKNFRVEVTVEKKERIKKMAQDLLDKQLVAVREMAAFTGLVISCAPAVGRSARFCTRASVAWCQNLVDRSNWGAKGELLKEVREELEFWVNRLEEFSGQLIRHSAEILEFYVCSDSGEHQIGGRVCKKGTEQVHKRFQVSLEDWEKELSSTYRELRSIESGLELIGPEAIGKAMRYGNDNYAACKIVEFGSTKEDCHEVAKRIAILVEKYDIKLEMVWRRRNTEEITLCDKISKEFDLSEYRIEEESFQALEEEFGPWEVDWFASDWSKRLPRFVSRYWTVGSEHTDAFTRDWFEDEGFFHPPLSELARVVEKMVQFGARGVLLVPDWSGSEADSVMRQAREFMELVGVRKLCFESPSWRKDNTFRGVPEFGMRVYRILSNGYMSKE